LLWSKNVNEIVSTHGYSQNQIVVWKYSSMTKLATLTGHTLRVLYLAVSPDGQTIVTGAGTLLESSYFHEKAIHAYLPLCMHLLFIPHSGDFRSVPYFQLYSEDLHGEEPS
jgi:hypothetical protein